MTDGNSDSKKKFGCGSLMLVLIGNWRFRIP